MLVAGIYGRAQFLVVNADTSTGKDATLTAGNAVVRHKFTADPAAMVYKDKV